MKRFAVHENQKPLGYGIEFADGIVVYRKAGVVMNDMSIHTNLLYLTSFLQSDLGPRRAERLEIEYQDGIEKASMGLARTARRDPGHLPAGTVAA